MTSKTRGGVVTITLETPQPGELPIPLPRLAALPNLPHDPRADFTGLESFNLDPTTAGTGVLIASAKRAERRDFNDAFSSIKLSAPA